MNLDKPLEELIADKRAPAAGAATSRPARGRVSRDRNTAVPYARPAPRSTSDTWVHDAYNGPAAPRGRGGFNAGPGRQAVGNVGFTGISPRIQVAGLHYEVSTADLTNIFSQAGTIVKGPTIRYDRSGRSTGEAEMEFENVQQAKIAINKFDGAMTKGQTITITFLAPSRPPRPAASAPTPFGPSAGRPQNGASLLARIAGPGPNGGAAKGQAVPGVARGSGNARGRGGPARGRGGRGGAAVARAGPPDAGNLDKELDAFMKPDASGDVAMS